LIAPPSKGPPEGGRPRSGGGKLGGTDPEPSKLRAPA